MFCRHYEKGRDLLSSGKGDQALNEFRQAFIGVEQSDAEIISRLNLSHYEEKDYAVHYFRQVAELFEQRGFNNEVIELCCDGINASNIDNNETFVLWTLLFKRYLETEKFDEAFLALNKNPDRNMKNTCLRLFVIRLFEMKEIEKLVNYQYSKLESEFVEFLELRARNVDVTVDNYYEILSSYFINRSNYRRAASYFYELSERFKLEGAMNEKSCRLRINALCGCIQCLSIVRADYQWIVRPNANFRKQFELQSGGVSPKRSADGGELPSTFLKTDAMKIVELIEIKKELILAKSNLIVMSKMKIGNSPPSEVMLHLLSLKEFDAAFSLAVNFHMNIENVFTELTNACVTDFSSKSSGNNYKWMETNRTFTSIVSADFHSSEQCWKILEGALKYFGSDLFPMSKLCACVCRCLLSYSYQLPTWLTLIFKKVDFPEFLRLLVEFDRLDQAETLLIDYVEAVLGNGVEEFGLKNALHANQPAVLLPYSSIDQLLSELTCRNSLEKKNEIEKTMQKYFHHLDMANNSFVNLSRR